MASARRIQPPRAGNSGAMPRAIFFDVDGVLVHGYHSNPEKSVRWDENLLRDLGIDPEEFRHKFVFEIFISEVLTGRRPLVSALEEVLPDLGFHRSPMILVDYWMRHDSNIDEDLMDIVARMARSDGAALYLATNQEHMRALWLWQSLGMSEHFADIFYAARMGTLKPEGGFFESVMKRIGPQVEPPLLFDDSPKVVEGARAFGWDAVLYERIADVAGHPAVEPLLT